MTVDADPRTAAELARDVLASGTSTMTQLLRAIATLEQEPLERAVTIGEEAIFPARVRDFSPVMDPVITSVE